MKRLREALQARPANPSAVDPSEVRCRYCRNVIQPERGPSGPLWMTPISAVPAGVTLPIECPARPVEGTATSFWGHEPPA